MDFQVGDLITLKHYGTAKTPAPLAIVVSTHAILFDRIMIQHRGTSGPEFAVAVNWKVVSRNENR